jgi:thioredoxin reductase (NADPH)
MGASTENVIIVGSGPAGYTAALYAARAELAPLVIEGFAWGGLLQQTTDVENYPGFTDGVMGPVLMGQMREQAERFGARLLTDEATRVELAGEPGGIHRVWVDEEEHSARSVILAMGAQHRKLGVPGEAELAGRGVSYCATCDAAFFKKRPAVIVGGGDSAMEEAMFLAKFASTVTVVNRREEFRASRIMLDRARAVPNIEWLTPYVVEELLSCEKGTLGSARLRNTETGETRVIELAGAFVAIGHVPQSELVSGQIDEWYLRDTGESMLGIDSLKRTAVGGSLGL